MLQLHPLLDVWARANRETSGVQLLRQWKTLYELRLRREMHKPVAPHKGDWLARELPRPNRTGREFSTRGGRGRITDATEGAPIKYRYSGNGGRKNKSDGADVTSVGRRRPDRKEDRAFGTRGGRSWTAAATGTAPTSGGIGGRERWSASAGAASNGARRFE